MTFKIRCPQCHKPYTAEPHLIGKRIRCKKCGKAFVVEKSADAPTSPVPAPPALMTAPSAVVAAHTETLADLGDLISRPRSSEPKVSAVRASLETYLRRTLILFASGLAAAFTIKQNRTGLLWIPMLRLGIIFLLFLFVILPVTYQSVAANFRRIRIKLPAAASGRVASIFSVPASLGFVVWQLYKTPLALTGGLLGALPLLFGAYWLQFPRGFLEAVTDYVRACISFVVGTTVAVGIVLGINFVINRALINAHATAFKESPLGEALAWQAPQPLPVALASVEVIRHTVQEAPSSGLTTPAPIAPPSVLFDLSDATSNVPPGAGATSRAGAHLFVNPEDDQFLADLEKNTQPWVKQISRPEGQSPFDFLIVPNEVSPYLGFVTLDAKLPANRRFGVGLAIDSRIRRAASFDITHDANPHAFPRDYLLNGEGTLLLHLNGLQMEMISTATHRKDTFALSVPDRAPRDRLLPQLEGMTPNHGILVRWSGPAATEQVVQRYAYATRQLTDTAEIHDASLATESSAVGAGEAGTSWLASIITPARQPMSISLLNVGRARGQIICAAMPSAVVDLSNYEHVELAFSPDGKQIALQLTDRSQAAVYIWKSNDLSAMPLKVTPPMLAPSLAYAHVAGPRICWINESVILVDGQAVVSTVADHAGIIGMLSDTASLGAVTTSPDHVLLSYLGSDGLCHLAEVEFDGKALREAAPIK